MNNENIMSSSDEVEIDLQELFKEITHRWWMVLIGCVTGIVIAALVTIFAMQPMYSAKAMIYLRGSGNTIASLSDLQIGAQLTNDYSVIFKSRTLLTQVIDNLKLDMTYETLGGLITISNPTDTRILQVDVKCNNAALACDIANKVVEYGADAAKEIDSKEPYMIDRAVIENTPVSPSIIKNTIIGGIIGILLVMIVLVMRYVLNDALQTDSDIERYLGLPVLCSVPESRSCEYERSNMKKGVRRPSRR